jgi:hypothetical protein
MYEEHICLASDEVEEPAELVPTTMEAVLDQNCGKHRRRLVLFNGSYLAVSASGPHSKASEYNLKLAFVDIAPVRHVARLHWAIFAATAVPVAVLLAAQFMAGIASSPGWLAAGALLLTAALWSLAVALHRYFDRLIFLTRHGRVPVVEISRSRPERRRTRTFIDKLRKAIRQAQLNSPPVHGHYLRDEMREHRRLFEQGVTSPEQFERAKVLILRAHG